MNDIPDITTLSDNSIMEEMGRFIQTIRLSRNLTQEMVAERAAISRSTLSLAERGENIALGNLVKILRVLDALYVFDQFRVVKTISPIQLAKEDEKRRQRVRSKPDNTDQNEPEW